MKFLHIFIFVFIFLNNLFGQQLDGFKYVYINELQYENGPRDKYSLVSIVEEYFTDLGLKIIMGNQFVKENNNNPCEIIFCEISHTQSKHPKNSTKIDLLNCNNNIVLSSSESDLIWLYYWEESIRNATKKALKKLKIKSYNFDESKTPKLDLPIVENTHENEESLIEYFENNTIDNIEGIYKLMDTRNEGSHYKIGIKKYSYKYKAIIVESNTNTWKVGEVKFILEPSSVKNMYSCKYYKRNKQSVETFCNISSKALLEISSNHRDKDGNEIIIEFLKLYPSNIVTLNPEDNEGDFNNNSQNKQWKGNGSGIIISKDGFIVTNFHVIDGINEIEVEFKTLEDIKKYNAKVINSDPSNDLAIIQIDDSEFNNLKSIPYNFKTRSVDVGTEVFALGYPKALDLMGKEIKFTDGRVSAKTGFQGDITSYQTTTPIQPGNSGGPLFDHKGNLLGINSAKIVSKDVEGVSYTIKTSYLLNLIDVLPKSIPIPSNTILSTKSLTEQVKILSDYVVLIKVK